jgi:hypothetical protein
MTTLTDFQTHCSKTGTAPDFDGLADMFGGADKVFTSYLEGSMDQDLKDWVLMHGSRALTAFTMAQLAQFEASSFFSIMGMLNQINLNLKEINAGMKAMIQTPKVQ